MRLARWGVTAWGLGLGMLALAPAMGRADAPPPKAPAACGPLQGCCATLPTPEQRAGCARVVEIGDERTCTSTFQSFQAAGYCSSGTNCAAVAKCCAKVPPGKASLCRDVLAAKNEISCGIAIPQIRDACPDVFPAPAPAPKPAPPPAGRLCGELKACCPSLDASSREHCETVLSSSSRTEAQCGGILQNHRARGACKTTEKGCALLAACAPKVRPMHAPVCAAALKKGDDVGCFSILGTMQQLGSCLD